ncbi:hypothetical protein QUB05_13340 [Microcoleus sp. F10-C6]
MCNRDLEPPSLKLFSTEMLMAASSKSQKLLRQISTEDEPIELFARIS